MGYKAEDIKSLREETGCGVIDCKKALEDSDGNRDKAKDLLRKLGLEKALKKGDREAKEGRVESYIHNGSKIGVIVEINCETDFVARSEDFIKFSKDVAMHIAAMSPKYIKKEDVPADILAKEHDQADFLKQAVLLQQPFVRDAARTIQDYLNELIAKIGENIRVARFVRYKIGE